MFDATFEIKGKPCIRSFQYICVYIALPSFQKKICAAQTISILSARNLSC